MRQAFDEALPCVVAVQAMVIGGKRLKKGELLPLGVAAVDRFAMWTALQIDVVALGGGPTLDECKAKFDEVRTFGNMPELPADSPFLNPDALTLEQLEAATAPEVNAVTIQMPGVATPEIASKVEAAESRSRRRRS